jgi:hypothetical protein
VNCDHNKHLCEKHKIRAFPTLRFFRHGVAVSPDYHEHRTIEDLIKYIRNILEIHPKTILDVKGSNDFGCQIQGNILLNRSVALPSPPILPSMPETFIQSSWKCQTRSSVLDSNSESVHDEHLACHQPPLLWTAPELLRSEVRRFPFCAISHVAV